MGSLSSKKNEHELDDLQPSPNISNQFQKRSMMNHSTKLDLKRLLEEQYLENAEAALYDDGMETIEDLRYGDEEILRDKKMKPIMR